MADVVLMVILGVLPLSVGWLWHFRRMSVSTYLHGIKTQKTVIWINRDCDRMC